MKIILNKIYNVKSECQKEIQTKYQNKEIQLEMNELVEPLMNKLSYETTKRGIELLSRLLSVNNHQDDHYYKMIRNSLDELIDVDKNIFRLRIVIFDWNSIQDIPSQTLHSS